MFIILKSRINIKDFSFYSQLLFSARKECECITIIDLNLKRTNIEDDFQNSGSYLRGRQMELQPPLQMSKKF